MKLETLFDKDELRRLEKAARDKNKAKLKEWAIQFENQLRDNYEEKLKGLEDKLIQHHEKEYEKILAESVDNFIVAIIYTLHFNEKCKFGNNRIVDFMDDLLAVVDGFKTGEYTPEEYKEILKKQKIYFKEATCKTNN